MNNAATTGNHFDLDGVLPDPSEDHYRAWKHLAEMLPQLVWTTRADGWADYTNQRFCDYTHATPERLQGCGWVQFLHPEDAERVLAVRAHAFRTGIPYEVEYRLREGQTGCYRWFLVWHAGAR